MYVGSLKSTCNKDVGNLKQHICVYIYRLLYKKLMVTINRKPTIDTHKKGKGIQI